MSSHEIIIIWLDSNIGVPGEYIHLKQAFSTNIDPMYAYPRNLNNRDPFIFDLNENDSICKYQFQNRCKLQFFTDEEQCFTYVNKCFNANKQIFLILPDSIRKDFFLRIYEQHSKEFEKTKNEISIRFYLFTFSDVIQEWLYDYEDYFRVYYHEADLLYALIRDIAIYYMMIGEKLLNENLLNDTHRALIYLHWANTLIHRGNSISSYKEIQLQNYLINMINKCENRIYSIENVDYLQCDLINKLIQNIIIYDSTESFDQGLKLKTIFNQINDKNSLLFNNLEDFFLNFQSTNYNNQRHCIIMIISNIDKQTNTFEALSSIQSIEHIYVLHLNGNKFIEQNNYRTLLKKFPTIRNISTNIKTLLLGWIVEHSTECEQIGDYFKENEDSNLADLYYAKSIKLNACLSIFTNKN
ncbi:unnamed protein product [Rotaria sordida]|uniref:Uncharacterized protein n=1 Tax=Rotaria sordida TaxID=392033 RepID=A0A818R3T9_9BILA|nr:unnamed protein product [Rotaria sordida]